MNFFKHLVCWLKGHWYYPTCQWQYSGHWRKPKKQRWQYKCERCGQPTKWMRVAAHNQFLKDKCPSWGGPGSDSQGYKD